MRHFRAGIRFVLLFLWIVAICCIGTFTYIFSRHGIHPWFVVMCNQGELILAGVKVRVIGTPPKKASGILFVANHCSYLDIAVYGSLLPVCYTPKAEIKRWPLIGQLTILARSVFITRKKEEAFAQRKRIRQLLEQGENILLFPEGTTNDGGHVKPFKSTLFSVVEPQEGRPDIPVHAMVLRYTVEGVPPGSGRMLDRVAWYGDMMLLPHLWGLLSMRRVEAEVEFLPPVTWQGDRKHMAKICGEMVRGRFEAALTPH